MKRMCDCNQGRLPCGGNCQTTVPANAGAILKLMGGLFFVAVFFSLVGVLLK